MERRTERPLHPWHPYDATICTLSASGALAPLVVDFRDHVGAATRAALHARLGGSFSIVTAHNPSFLAEGRTDDDANRRAHERLLDRVRALGVACIEATGRAADGGHEELGVAFALVGEPARAIAVDFGQDAYFEFEGGRFAIVPACRTDLGRATLP